jgi:hypothetical protein
VLLVTDLDGALRDRPIILFKYVIANILQRPYRYVIGSVEFASALTLT